jgi:hypothetical protein
LGGNNVDSDGVEDVEEPLRCCENELSTEDMFVKEVSVQQGD